MKRNIIIVCGLIGMAAVVLFSCNSTFKLNEQRKQWNASASPASESPITFQQIQQNPNNFNGRTTTLGGMIADIISQNTTTEMVITQTPLDENRIPRAMKYSEGRFIARTYQPVDVNAYKIGQEVTIEGIISGSEIKPLGDGGTYLYPVITIHRTYLWQDQVPAAPYRCRDQIGRGTSESNNDKYSVPCNDKGNYYQLIAIDSSFILAGK